MVHLAFYQLYNDTRVSAGQKQVKCSKNGSQIGWVKEESSFLKQFVFMLNLNISVLLFLKLAS